MSNKLLSKALEELYLLQKQGNVFQTSDFSGKNMTYLKKAGYWEFVSKYLHKRFGNDYCLNPEMSILLHTKSSIIPRQIVAITKKGSLGKVELLHDTSIFIYHKRNAREIPKRCVSFTLHRGI